MKILILKTWIPEEQQSSVATLGKLGIEKPDFEQDQQKTSVAVAAVATDTATVVGAATFEVQSIRLRCVNVQNAQYELLDDKGRAIPLQVGDCICVGGQKYLVLFEDSPPQPDEACGSAVVAAATAIAAVAMSPATPIAFPSLSSSSPLSLPTNFAGGLATCTCASQDIWTGLKMAGNPNTQKLSKTAAASSFRQHDNDEVITGWDMERYEGRSTEEGNILYALGITSNAKLPYGNAFAQEHENQYEGVFTAVDSNYENDKATKEAQENSEKQSKLQVFLKKIGVVSYVK